MQETAAKLQSCNWKLEWGKREVDGFEKHLEDRIDNIR